MTDLSVVIQRPSVRPDSPILLFQGMGASPDDMLPLGQRIAAQDARAFIVAVAAPDPSDLGHGRQWFSVTGVTEINRPDRVESSMPRFEQTIASWQRERGLVAARTVLVGFFAGCDHGT